MKYLMNSYFIKHKVHYEHKDFKKNFINTFIDKFKQEILCFVLRMFSNDLFSINYFLKN
jgi:hypothetical protein